MSSRTLGNRASQVGAVLRAGVRRLRVILPRIYALAIAIVIIWLTYEAVAYLVTSLALPNPTPAQIAALPTRLDRQELGQHRSAFQALDAAEHPRSPLAHYHRLDSWVQPDPFNDCARSGCHNPLPHSKHKEVRAFLNMHATSIHCGVCHMKSDAVPIPLVWYDLASGEACQPPAVMRAYAILTDPVAVKALKAEGPAGQDRLLGLLRDAAHEAGDLPALVQLADHFAAFRVGSAGFDQMIEEGPAVLSRHFRGEYGAKLARPDESGKPLVGHPNTENAIQRWEERKNVAGEDERKKLLEAVHPLRRQAALTCTDCHRGQNSLIDFEKLGYPKKRISDLVNPVIFRMIEHLNAGRPFQLPSVLGGKPLPPPAQSQPANR